MCSFYVLYVLAIYDVCCVLIFYVVLFVRVHAAFMA